MDLSNKNGTNIAPTGTGTNIAGTGTNIAGTGTNIAGTGTNIAGNNGATNSTKAALGSVDAIPELPEYTIKNIRYRTVDVVKKRSGEAKVIIVEQGGRKFALKLYICGHFPDAKILDIVQKKAQGGFLINVHDHGIWTDPTTPGKQHYYEVMEYAPYGSLADIRIRDEKQFKEIAIRMAFCIDMCHRLGIIHRDIKPENFLFTDAGHTNFVLTDFGIARIIANKDSRVSVDNAKSGYFVSPEGAMSANNRTSSVGIATDYYSMGVTLLSMWLEVKNFYKRFSEDDLLEYKQENRIIDECGASLKLTDYSKSLLKALTEFRPSDRAGIDEIKRWYSGETLKNASVAANTGFRIVFNEDKNKIASSKEELAKMMLDDIEYAKLFLYRGIALHALQQAGLTALALRIDQITQKNYPAAEDQDAGVYASCLLLDKQMPYIGLKGKRYTALKEIGEEIWHNSADYSKDLRKKTARLWAYFAARGDDKVKALQSTYQPIIARSGIHGVYALCKELIPSLPLYSKKGSELRTGKDIADELWANRGEYTTELANQDHSVWVYLRSVGVNGHALAGKYPSIINNSKLAGVYSLCLQLNSDMPWFGKSNNACVTEKQVADELWKNLGDYKKELADSNHLLWMYMRTWGGSWVSIADKYPGLIAKKADIWAYDLVYRLDPSKPYVIQYLDDNKWYNQSSFDSLLENIYIHGITDFSLTTLTGADFVTWLSNRDGKRAALLEQLIKNLGAKANSKANAWFILYSIAPEASFTMQRDSKAKDYIGSTRQIATEIMNQLNNCAPQGKGAADKLLPMLNNYDFDPTRLAQYMRARKMDSYVNGIKKIVNIAANTQSHPAAPYNSTIAAWKVVQYLGEKPVYKCSNGKSVGSLDDVRKLSGIARSQEANKGLADFLTLFFHEKVGAQFTSQALRDYYDFLCTYLPDHAGIKRTSNLKNNIDNAITKRDKAWARLHNIRIFTLIFCLIPTIAILGWMLYTSFTDGAGTLGMAFEAVGKVISVILAIIGALAGLSGGLIGAVIGGLAGYWIPYWIFQGLSAIAPFIVAAIVISAAVFLIIKLIKFTSDSYIQSQSAYDNLTNQAALYTMCEAFGTTSRTFSSNPDPTTIFSKSENLANQQRKSVYKAAIGLVVLAIATLAIGISLMKTTEEVEYGYIMPDGAMDKDDVVGEYGGTFHERKARMSLEKISSYDSDYDYKGEVVINYSTPMTHQVYGKYLSDGKVILYVVEDGNINFTKQYEGYVKRSSDIETYSGTYTNTWQGTEHKFKFTK